MFPGMQWVVLSTDLEFCEDVRRMLGNVEADVYVATTWEEYERLQAEGGRSPADVILTVDIARLNVYADKNLLESVRSKTLERDL